jgi:phosphoribosyl-AMP cyclohydrolase
MRVPRLAFNKVLFQSNAVFKDVHSVLEEMLSFLETESHCITPSSGLTATFSHRKALWEKGFY